MQKLQISIQYFPLTESKKRTKYLFILIFCCTAVKNTKNRFVAHRPVNLQTIYVWNMKHLHLCSLILNVMSLYYFSQVTCTATCMFGLSWQHLVTENLWLLFKCNTAPWWRHRTITPRRPKPAESSLLNILLHLLVKCTHRVVAL